MSRPSSKLLVLIEFVRIFDRDISIDALAIQAECAIWGAICLPVSLHQHNISYPSTLQLRSFDVFVVQELEVEEKDVWPM